MGLHSENVLVLARQNLNLISAELLDSSHRLVVGLEGSGTRDNARDVLDQLGLGFEDVDTIMRDPRQSLDLLGTDSADIRLPDRRHQPGLLGYCGGPWGANRWTLARFWWRSC